MSSVFRKLFHFYWLWWVLRQPLKIEWCNQGVHEWDRLWRFSGFGTS